MISRILIIAPGGLLTYQKNFVGTRFDVNDEKFSEADLISGFIMAITNFAIEIKGGKINSLNFRNFNLIFTYDDEVDCIFVLICDIHDLVEEIKEKAEILKGEFIKRFKDHLISWTGEISVFQEIDDFVEENIYIPPKILLIGEDGVGKTAILDLFPGETILELDEDLNEIIQKPINVSGLKIKQFLLRELNMDEIIDNAKLFRPIIESADAILVVTNSGASNLGRTKKKISIIQEKVKNADFYIIANFQDYKDQAFDPKKIEDTFRVKTFGFSAKKDSAKEDMFNIMVEVLNSSIIEKITKFQKDFITDTE